MKIGETGLGDNFDGYLDEVRIYNRVLTADEIKRLYKIGSTLKQGAPNSSGSLASGLVGWWTFDGNDTGTTSVLDRSGNGTLGYLTNGTQKAIGKIGQGLTFDGVNDNVSLGTPAVLDLQQNSVSAWVKRGIFPLGAEANILSIGAAEGVGTEFGIGLNETFVDGTPDFEYLHDNSGDIIKSTASLPLDTWTHVAGTWDGATMKLYINGVLDNSRAEAGAITEWGNLAFIGSHDNGEYFPGTIDDIRIYNRALSADEVKRLYKMGSTAKVGVASNSGGINNGLVGYWSFDGKDAAGNVAYDRSGQGNHGTLTNGPARSIGKIGQALEFDQLDDYVDFGAMELAGSAMTISAWVYRRAVPSGADCFDFDDCRIIDKSTGTSEEAIYWMISTIFDGSKAVLRARLKTNGTMTCLVSSDQELLENGVHWVLC